MLREKPKLFTIGQFAALHGINKKTLMWYDEIGLFKPAFIHEENGYRLYSYYQSTELEVILLLRDMNVPIRDIQEFMKNRSAGSMADLLRDKISELDRTIQGLKAVRSKLCSRRQEMTELLDLDLSEISLIEREPQYLATVQTSPEKSLEEEIELILEQTKKYQLPRMLRTTPSCLSNCRTRRTGWDSTGAPAGSICGHSALGIGTGCLPAMKRSSATQSSTIYSSPAMPMRLGSMNW